MYAEACSGHSTCAPHLLDLSSSTRLDIAPSPPQPPENLFSAFVLRVSPKNTSSLLSPMMLEHKPQQKSCPEPGGKKSEIFISNLRSWELILFVVLATKFMLICYNSPGTPIQGPWGCCGFLKNSAAQQKNNARYIISNFLVVMLKRVKSRSEVKFTRLFFLTPYTSMLFQHLINIKGHQ